MNFFNKFITSFKNSLCLIISALLTINFISYFFPGFNDVSFSFSTSEAGEIIGNKLSNANVWDGVGKTDYDCGDDTNGFIEYIQLMQATGGSETRDLFINPLNNTVKNDYDFSKLIAKCHDVLSFGAKPLIKLGSVPLKLTSVSSSDHTFGTNIYPPDDYNEYYNYISEVIKALVKEFSLEEVRSWRFGVMTEFENSDWFMAKSGNPRESAEAYCKLYDYTVGALTDILGDNVYVGAHAMSVTEGLWDEGIFIEHCAKGTNYYTGKTGSRICYLSGSFYDLSPGRYTSGFNLPGTINNLRSKAESVGLYGLRYGIDEDRILVGNSSGQVGNELNMRIVGDTWQAAYDARLLKQAADNNIDYISSWGYLSGGLTSGYPTVSYHVADLFSKMADSRKLNINKKDGYIYKAETDAVAGYNAETNTLRFMAYNFKNDLSYKTSSDMTFNIDASQFKNKKVRITKYVIDDNANYFDDWRKDRIKYNITDDKFCWSPDDPAIDTTTTLADSEARNFYYNNLRSGYVEKSKLVPTVSTYTVGTDGKLKISTTLEANTVVFYTVKPYEN